MTLPIILPTDSEESLMEQDEALFDYLETQPIPLLELERQERVRQCLKDWFLKIPYYAERQKADPEYLESLASSFHSI